MRLSGRRKRCVVLAFVLMSVLGALTASNSLLHGTVLSVAAQTDANGEYAFSAPVGLNYVPAVFSGSANVYTVAEPTDTAFPAAPSAVANVPVNAVPAYGIIAGVTGIVVLGLYVYTRAGTKGRLHIRPRLAALWQRLSSWTRRHALRRKERIEAVRQPTPEPGPSVDLAASSAAGSAKELPQQASIAEHGPVASDTVFAPGEGAEAATQPALESEPAREIARETSAVRRARDLFAEGRDRQAVGRLYDAASASLAKASTVTLLPNMTHWERYGAIEAAIPEVREPLRTLTVAFERTHYGGKSLTEEQRNAAIAAFKSISALAEPVEENT
ncbi:MAG: DUF4129 domain-containing protein [Halobacteriota archaeon]